MTLFFGICFILYFLKVLFNAMFNLMYVYCKPQLLYLGNAIRSCEKL